MSGHDQRTWTEPGLVPDLSREELEHLQLTRLRDTLHRAYANVPHYRRAFDEAGVRPEHLEALADLSRFPFTTKADLRDNYPFGMFAVPREEVARVRGDHRRGVRLALLGNVATAAAGHLGGHLALSKGTADRS